MLTAESADVRFDVPDVARERLVLHDVRVVLRRVVPVVDDLSVSSAVDMGR